MFTSKRVLSKMLIVMIIASMILSAVPVTFAAASRITGVETGENSISYNEEFTLKLTLNEKLGNEALDKYPFIKLTDVSNFTPTNGVTTISGTDESGNGLNVIDIPLKYVGSGNSLSVEVYDGTATDPIITETIIIPGVQTSSGDNGNTTDTSKYKPLLNVKSDEGVAVITDGGLQRLTIPIENISPYTAKDVIVSFADMSSDFPFKVNQSSLSYKVDTISRSKGGEAKFDLEILPTAQSKIYELKLNLKYTNSYGDIFTDNGNLTYYVEIKNTSTEPIVGITDYRHKEEKMTAGVPDQLLLVAENKGTIDARDIRIKLTGFDKDGIRLTGDVDTKAISSIEGKKSKSVYYNVTPAPNAKTQTYTLVAEISYIDLTGKEYTVSSPIYIDVYGKDASAVDLEVKNVIRPEVVKVSDDIIVEFDVENTGTIDAAPVEIQVEYPNAVIVPVTSPKEYEKLLKAGETKHYVFKFKVKGEAASGYNDAYITIKYNVEGADKADEESFQEYIGLNIEGNEGLGRPKILIQNYDFGAESVLAGQEFELNLDLFNTSSDEITKNIKVSLKSDSGMFTPVDMASSFFIERIGRQETVSKVIKIKTKPDAEVKGYGLTITFEYEDGKGNAYDIQDNPFKEEELITIPVSQPIRLETGDVQVPGDAYVGSQANISCEFYNLGKSTMYNMIVKIEGNFDAGGTSYFVGNMEAGRNDYYDASITPTEAGQVMGKIIFTFEDPSGNKTIEEKEFSMYVEGDGGDMSGEFPDGEFNPNGEFPDGFNPDMNPDGTSGSGPVEPFKHGKAMGIGILAFTAVLFIVIRQKKVKAEKMKELRY